MARNREQTNRVNNVDGERTYLVPRLISQLPLELGNALRVGFLMYDSH